MMSQGKLVLTVMCAAVYVVRAEVGKSLCSFGPISVIKENDSAGEQLWARYYESIHYCNILLLKQVQKCSVT